MDGGLSSQAVPNPRFSVVIQAGGESRRMGQDKGLMPFLGRPLVERVARRLQVLADEMLITTNNPAAYAFLGLPCIPDRLPGRGALGGLYTALSAASGEAVAVVACDMPFVSAGLLEYARGLLFSTPADLVIPRSQGGLEPFHAVYRREACLPYIEAALQNGLRRADAWFSQVRLHYLDAEEIAAHDPHGLAFLNVNTPEELQQAEQTARETEK